MMLRFGCKSFNGVRLLSNAEDSSLAGIIFLIAGITPGVFTVLISPSGNAYFLVIITVVINA